MEYGMEVPQKSKNRGTISFSVYLGIYLDKSIIQKDNMHPYVHSSTIHNSQDMETN